VVIVPPIANHIAIATLLFVISISSAFALLEASQDVSFPA
jgi:hypothetical protein